ncbi:hypothetical protein DFH06DRAFT_986911, partial [Mycena polygramma]
FCVLGIDYFLGDPIHNHTEEGFDRDAWIGKSRATAQELAPKWIEAVRKQYVGYCFGGPLALNIAGTDDVVAAAFAHHAFLNDDQFKNLKHSYPRFVTKTDHTFPAQFRRRAEDILGEKNAQYQVQLFSGVSHGSATRGDSEQPDNRSEESARGIIGWLPRFTT